MALLSIPNVLIEGVSACVPKRVVENEDSSLLGKDELEKYIATTGVRRKHCALPDGTLCASDLCLEAAEKLISELRWDKKDIGLLVFVSQTQDYKLPATSCILQNRLGLSSDTMSFDVSYGCSGFVYGLSIAGSIVSTNKIKKALLLVGNTQSFYASPEDKSMSLLLGDAGTAMALSYSENASHMNFSLHSDGSGKDFLIVPDGGCRNPFSECSSVMEEFEDNIKRSRLHEKMDGLEVFSFGLRAAPAAFRELKENYGVSEENTDYLCLHQANRFLCEKIRKKLKFPPEKVPYNIEEFGNTSGATIPLLLVTSLKNQLESNSLNLAGIGFGVGLSWGAVSFHTDRITVPDLMFL